MVVLTSSENCMSSQRNERPQLFTVERANLTLPYVRRIAEDLAGLSSEIVERRTALVHLMEGRDVDSGDPYIEELAQVERELEKDSDRLAEFINEIRALGAEPKNGPGGTINLVDFPAMVDGEIVYLCWQLGEPEVRYWHHIEAGFAGRQLLKLEGSTAE